MGKFNFHLLEMMRDPSQLEWTEVTGMEWVFLSLRAQEGC